MSRSQAENIREQLGCVPDLLNKRLGRVYEDTFLHDKYNALKAASDHERPALEAQMESYLAAAHTLFPEESRVVYGKIAMRDLYEK